MSHVHLKDVDRDLAGRVATRELSYKEGATRGMYRPLGDGDVDVGRVIDLHERAGYRGWYVLEQDTVVETDFPQGEGPISDVRKSLDFVKGRLAGARAGERGADG